MLKTDLRGCPIASREDQPVRFSPALLIMMILPCDVGRDDAVFDRTQGDREAFLVRRDFHLEAFPLRHVANHGDVKLLLVHHHFAQRNFDRESRVAPRPADRQGGAAGLPREIIPGAGDGLPFASIRFRNKLGELVADHLVVDAAEHLLGRGIHRADDALLIDRDHAIEDVLDDGADARFDAFQFGQLAADQHEAVTVRNDEQADREDAENRQRGCLDDAFAGRGVRAGLVKADLVLFESAQHLTNLGHQLRRPCWFPAEPRRLCRCVSLPFPAAAEVAIHRSTPLRILARDSDCSGEFAIRMER